MPSKSSDTGSPQVSGSKKWSKTSSRYLKTSSAALYSGVFLVILSLVAVGYRPPEHSSASASAVELDTKSDSLPAPTADELVATNVAANIAQTASLPVASNVSNLSRTLEIESALTKTTTNIVAKPQIVEPTADSMEVQTYVTKSGDTVPEVAKKYNVSSDTVRWANDLNSDALEPNKKLRILPVDGVLVEAKDGDTIANLAQKYDSNPELIKTFNDLEISGIVEGDKLIIPNGEMPEPEVTNTPIPTPTYGGNNYGTTPVNRSIVMASAGNRYAPGYCTYYVYERRAAMGRPIGSFWGNAVSWAASARAAGFTVNNTPAPGAIFQRGGGLGHVGVIDSVNRETGMVTYSDMNGLAGFNRVGSGTTTIADAKARWQFIH